MVVQNLYKEGTVIGQVKDLPIYKVAHDAAVRVIHHVAQRRSSSKLVDRAGGIYFNPVSS